MLRWRWKLGDVGQCCIRDPFGSVTHVILKVSYLISCAMFDEKARVYVATVWSVIAFESEYVIFFCGMKEVRIFENVLSKCFITVCMCHCGGVQVPKKFLKFPVCCCYSTDSIAWLSSWMCCVVTTVCEYSQYLWDCCYLPLDRQSLR